MWRQSYLVHTNSSCIVKKSRNIFLFNVLSGRKSSLPPLQSFLRETFLSGFMAYFILILNLLYIYLLSLGPFCVECSIKLGIRILIIWEYGKHIHTYELMCVFVQIWVCWYATMKTKRDNEKYVTSSQQTKCVKWYHIYLCFCKNNIS